MNKEHTEISAGDGAVSAQNIHGDVNINNTYLIQSGYTEQDIKDKESQYLGWVFENCGGLEWLSLMELKEGQSAFSLDAVYTPLLSKSRQDEAVHKAMGLDDEDYSSIRQGRLSMVELLNKEQKLVLLGDPGSGKSAFVDFVSLCMAGQRLGEHINLNSLTEPLPDQNGTPQQKKIKGEEKYKPYTEIVHQRWDHGTLIPLKIILRDFATSKCFPEENTDPTAKHILSFIKKTLKANCIDGYYGILKKRLETGQVLVMFDGLDEVAQAGQRRERLVACIDAFSKSFRQSRFLVTCRPYAYREPEWQLPRFTSDELAEFENGQIIRFIRRWYQQMPSKDREKTQAHGQQLQQAILSRPALKDLAKRPLLLSLIAYLHAYRYGLPDRRAELYERLLDLLVDKWEKARFKVNDDDITQARELSQDSLAEYLQMGKDAILNVLKRLAFEAHALQDGDQDTADIRAKDLYDGLLEAADECENKKIRPMELSEHLRDRVGILYQRTGSSYKDAIYTFPHRSFQEYLAAEYFRLESKAMFKLFDSHNFEFEHYTWQELAAKLARTDPDRWREVVVLAGGIRATNESSMVWGLLKELSRYKCLESLTASECWGLRFAGEILVESAKVKDMTLPQEKTYQHIQQALPHILGTEHLPAKERAQAGRYLAKIGDPRSEVMKLDAMKFCFVPKGGFWMGQGEFDKDDEAWSLAETPAGEYDLSYDYWMAQSPITVAQFKEYLEESGADIGDPDVLSGFENSPVVWISQQEAQAFCEWLTQKWASLGLLPKGYRVSLPNEPEWEKAARGGFDVPITPIVVSISHLQVQSSVDKVTNEQPQRRYPFLNDIGYNLVNYEGKVGDVSTTGVYPLGISPYGCLDLVGNVWEWTRSDKGEYPYPEVDTDAWKAREAEELSGCVFRGGASYDDQRFLRCASRGHYLLGNRRYFVGFRVVLSPLL